MAQPGTHHLRVVQGDDYAWPVRFETRHADGSTTPFSLEGQLVQAQIRRRDADTDAGAPPLATLTVVVEDALGGIVTLFLSSEDSTLLTGNARWDLQLTRTSDDWTRTVLAGDVLVWREVTRV